MSRASGTGLAGLFRITNATNSNPALQAETNGSGPGIRSVSRGTGPAGSFEVDNPASVSPALKVQTNRQQLSLSAFEPALRASAVGPYGSAAHFTVDHSQNFESALKVRTYGTGNAANFMVMNSSNNEDALTAVSFGPGFAAGFYGQMGVFISAASGQPALQVSGGTKSAIVRTSKGARALYSEEASEVWFSDYGFGRLRQGAARIELDALFAETVAAGKPYHVFLQAYGDAQLYVSQRTEKYFEVRVRDGGADVEFSYRLVAKRRGYEETRLEHAPWAEQDPNLYPEKRAAWEAKHREPKPVEPPKQ